MEPARLWAWLVIAAACLGTLSPAVPELRGRKGDSFPFSWYPMFAGERPDKERPTYVIGLSAEGKRVKIDVSYWTAGGFNQGRNELTTTVRAGEERREELCQRIAKKVATKQGRTMRSVVEVQIVKGVYDREQYFKGNTEPESEKVIHTCQVQR